MPVYENISEWECDRCGKKHFANPDDQYVLQWGRETRQRADGSKQAFVLCPECLASYQQFMAAQDQLFDKFMKGE